VCAAPAEAEESFFERSSARAVLESGKCVASQKAPSVDNRDAIGEQLDLGQSVGGEEQGSIATAENLGLQKAAKFESGDSVQAARRFIEEQDAGLVEQSASEAQALHRTRGKRTHLTVECFSEMEFFCEMSDALGHSGFRKMVQPAEEPQIFAAGKAGVEAEIAAGMVTELAANGARIENGIVSRDLRAAFCRQKKRSENPQERGFAGAVGTQQRQRFAWTHFERHASKGDDARLFEWLQKCAPAAARGRKRLLEISNVNRGFRHHETYSVSVG
jgi:hypothetical protein